MKLNEQKQLSTFSEVCLLNRNMNEIKNRLDANDDDVTWDLVGEYKRQLLERDYSEASDQDAFVECLLGNIWVFLATSDTTVGSILWMLLLLAAYPKIQAKIHDEIDNVVSRNSLITWEDRNRLPYTFASVRELERWMARLPSFVPRTATETFEFKGFKIHRGSMLIANGWALNRDLKYWDCPHEYRPERFLNSSVDKTPAGYGPFSFGKRVCPGKMIAMRIIFLYFTAIIQRFKVRTPSGEPPDLTVEFNAILVPKNQDLCFDERK